MHLLLPQVADAAGIEIERRWNEPYRKYRLWSKVSPDLATGVKKLDLQLEGLVWLIVGYQTLS